MTTLATRTFWIDAGERAAKTAAQAIDLFTIDFVTVVGVAGGGALLSLLTSVASVKRTGTASAV